MWDRKLLKAAPGGVEKQSLRISAQNTAVSGDTRAH